jgi:hypothetical protein
MFVLERLANAPKGPFFPGRDGGVEGRVGGNHDHHCFGIELEKFFQRAQTADSGHRDVEQHRIVGPLRVSIEPLFTGLGQIDAITIGREQRLEHVTHYFFVINDEHRSFFSHD